MRIVILLAQVAVLMCVAEVAQASEIKSKTLDQYARHAQFLDMKISPDGDFLAATARDDSGAVQLTILDIQNQNVVSITKANQGQSVATFHWVNNDRLLMTMAREVGALEAPIPTGEIFAMDRDGSRQKILTGPRSEGGELEFAQLLDVLPNEPDNVMIYTRSMTTKEPYLDVHRMRVSSGRKRSEGRIPLRAYSSTNVQILLDNNGVARVARGVDPEQDNMTVILARNGANEDWYELTKYNTDEGGFSPLVISSDGKTIIGLSDQLSDTQAIAMFDLETKEQTIVAEHPKTDLSPILSIDNGRVSEIVGAAYEYGELDAVLFEDVQDEHFVKLIQIAKANFPNQSFTITSTSKDNSKVVFRVGSANDPVVFYLFDDKKSKLTPIAPAKPWLVGKEIPKTESIVYESRDGLQIHALLTLPYDKDAKNLPLVLLPHGGPHGIRDSIASMDADAKVLAEHGYAVLQPNYRGSGGFGRKFLELGYRNWGTSMIDDMTDGVHHLIKQGIASRDRVCVYGASYGGYAALQSAIRESDLYKCAIGFVGVYDLELMYQQGDISEAQAGRNYLDAVLPNTEETRRAQSPLYNVDKLKAPVFIIQGETDVRVPKEHALRLREALEKRNHPVEWMMKAGEGHGFYKPTNNIERWEKMLTFLDAHIGK